MNRYSKKPRLDEEMKEIKYYKFWWWVEDRPFSNFDRGCIVLFTCLTAPIWIIPYLLYLAISGFGSLFKQKIIKREEDDEEQYF